MANFNGKASEKITKEDSKENFSLF